MMHGPISVPIQCCKYLVASEYTTVLQEPLSHVPTDAHHLQNVQDASTVTYHSAAGIVGS